MTVVLKGAILELDFDFVSFASCETYCRRKFNG